MPARPNANADTNDFEFAALDEARNYRAALVAAFRPYLTGRVLEAGAGIGQMTREFLTVGTISELVTLEPEPRYTERLRRFRPAELVVEGTSLDLPADAAWDAIISINVLEHIEDDAGELARYGRFLRPRRGHLCLLVPARPELYAPIDRDFGHYRRYARRELRAKLHAAGFTSVDIHYYNWVGYFAWLLSFRLLRRRGFDARAVRFFDRWIFPPVHWGETHLVRPCFGQNLIVVARA